MSVSKVVAWTVDCDGIDGWCRTDELEFTYADLVNDVVVTNQATVLRATRSEGWEVRGDGTTYCPLHRSRSPEPARELEEWEEA